MLRMTRMTFASTASATTVADDGFADLVLGDQVDLWLRTQPRDDAGLGQRVGRVHVGGNAMPHPAHLNSFALIVLMLPFMTLRRDASTPCEEVGGLDRRERDQQRRPRRGRWGQS